MAGFGELVSNVRCGHLYLACWDRFLSSPVSADSECGSGDNYCGTGRQPADWRLVLDIFRSHGVPLRALIGPIVAQFYLWLVPGWWPGAHFNRGWCHLWLTVRGALPYLLYVATVMGDRCAQTLLLGIAIFRLNSASSLRAINNSFIWAMTSLQSRHPRAR